MSIIRGDIQKILH